MLDRIADWKRIFDTEENAITKSLSRMAWELAAYSCLVEMVRAAPVAGDGKQLNSLFLDMLATGFWNGTMQGIRRLVEVEPIRGARSVCSLGGLIADIRAARRKLTREVYVRYIAGLEYNYLRTAAAHEAFTNEQLRQGNHSFWTPIELHQEYSQKRHDEFDWLSGVPSGRSRPDDIIREEVFDMLEARLDRLSKVIQHVNVEIAHAATEASRQGRVLDQWGLTDAKQAVREIAEVAHVVGNWFCFSGAGTMVPTPLFDQFAHLDRPLFTGDISRLQEVWNDVDREAQSWTLADPRSWMSQHVAGGVP
ncbi:hypothetical protein ACV344_29810 [Pseudomonas aeruginosa]|uniref:hypothetical protein n=1 Tax=Pseudomonas aeruginosa TaxID=287 RepID=UPI000E6829E0|nr:hypothetical protein [Pseudomonas aeruginosa]MBA5106204.1 hypothetical protein [Pseudomonas aeruginosa]MBD1300231.1 hypothetical protein [Pseudomonas aeruginosa]MBD1340786.1 hypothetical protein [Pseudomonas aeruginosa]MBG4604190.1 hypothetical protein [Pseudomonas aeruginosa]MBH3592972.1 hypothetical protein [Pseudomonas aeruginosa]